jgi:NADH-quinone oxidoreductase subunit H
MIDLWQSLHPLIQAVLKGLAVIAVIFPLGGACSLAERKVSAWMQGRPGPNRALPPIIGFGAAPQTIIVTLAGIAARIPVLGPILQKLGVFHLMADGGKMILKEDPIPGHVHKFYFVLAPLVGMIPALTTVTTVPLGAYLDAAGRTVPLVLANLDIGILAVFAVSSMGVYSLILAGWASNSKYPFLGGVRASAQLISYELSMTLSVLPVFLWINSPGGEGTLSLARVVEFQSQPGFWGGAWFIFLMPVSALVFLVALFAETNRLPFDLWINSPGGEGTLSLARVVEFQSGSWQSFFNPGWGGVWFIFLMPVSALVFLVALFAETNRLPFDMAEGEADLVGGFHTEYGALKWGLFFVAEYAHMMIGSAVFILLFLGGWNPLPWVPLADVAAWLNLAGQPVLLGLLSLGIFLGKVLFFLFVFMWVRWTVPRFRYDQVMKMGWQKLLPLSIGNLVFYACVIAILELRLGAPAWTALGAGTLAALYFAFVPTPKPNHGLPG